MKVKHTQYHKLTKSLWGSLARADLRVACPEVPLVEAATTLLALCLVVLSLDLETEELLNL